MSTWVQQLILFLVQDQIKYFNSTKPISQDWHLITYYNYPKDIYFDGNTKYTFSSKLLYNLFSFYRPRTSNIFMSMESYQTQTHIYIDFQWTNDDSNEEALETFSNLLPTFGQNIFSKSSTNENTQVAISSYQERSILC